MSERMSGLVVEWVKDMWVEIWVSKESDWVLGGS